MKKYLMTILGASALVLSCAFTPLSTSLQNALAASITATNATAAVSTDPTISYTVQPGDTLSALAQTYNTTVAAIQTLNPQITDPSLIYAGQVILIPENSATTPVIPITGSGTFTYIVQPGDTLSALAQTYNTTVAAIQALNPQITDPSLIYSGESIIIPAGQTSVTTPTIPVTGAFTYIVQPGDNLSTLAQEYGTTVAAIVALNPQITNPSLIYSGEVITIP
jgi:LysM repeat protein